MSPLLSDYRRVFDYVSCILHCFACYMYLVSICIHMTCTSTCMLEIQEEHHLHLHCTCMFYKPEHGLVLNPPVEDPLLPLLWGQFVLVQYSVRRREGQ